MASNAKGNGVPVFDRAYRINELSKIEEKITLLLRSAGLAIQALTTQPLPNQESPQSDLDARKEAFSHAATEYFSALSYIDVNLRRQFYALEEANIIPAEIAKEFSGDGVDDEPGAETGAVQVVKPTTGTAGSGSMGSLDVGWLNSRNDRVAVDMQAGLWDKLRVLLKDIDLRKLVREGEDEQDKEEEAKVDEKQDDKMEEDNVFGSLVRHLDGLSKKT